MNNSCFTEHLCLTCQVESHGTESDHAGAEKEAGSAGGREGQGGEEAEHSELRPAEPRDEDQRGPATTQHPQTEPDPAV